MWATEKLGEVCSVRRGTSITKKHAVEGKVPVIAGGTKPAYYHNQANRNADCTTISGSGNAGYVNFWKQPIFASDCTTVQPKDDSQDNRFVFYYLKSQQQYIYDNLRSGTTLLHVYAKDIAVLDYPVLPLAEQQRIANKLDSAFAEIDKAIAATERKKAEVVNLKRAVLVDKLSAQRGSVTVTIGELCTIANGGTPASKQSEYWGNGHQWLTPKDMGKLTSCYVSTTERQITDAGLNNSSAKVMPPKSIILSSRAPIGYVAVNTVPMAFNQGCRGLIPKDKITAEYLYYFLLSSRKLLDDLGAGTTFKELSTKALASIEFPLPQLAEQSRIVEKLDAIFTNIDKVANIATKQLANYQALKTAILKQELQGPTK